MTTRSTDQEDADATATAPAFPPAQDPPTVVAPTVVAPRKPRPADSAVVPIAGANPSPGVFPGENRSPGAGTAVDESNNKKLALTIAAVLATLLLFGLFAYAVNRVARNNDPAAATAGGAVPAAAPVDPGPASGVGAGEGATYGGGSDGNIADTPPGPRRSNDDVDSGTGADEDPGVRNPDRSDERETRSERDSRGSDRESREEERRDRDREKREREDEKRERQDAKEEEKREEKRREREREDEKRREEQEREREKREEERRREDEKRGRE